MLLKSENYEKLDEENILPLKFDEESIIRCYSRLENGNKNSHPIMLSKNYELTKLMVLRCHKKVYHNGGVKQTLNDLQAEFWINRGRSYVRKLLNNCFICRGLRSRSYNYPQHSNLPSYRINATVPLQVCGVDYLGPLYVKDINVVMMICIKHIL